MIGRADCQRRQPLAAIGQCEQQAPARSPRSPAPAGRLGVNTRGSIQAREATHWTRLVAATPDAQPSIFQESAPPAQPSTFRIISLAGWIFRPSPVSNVTSNGQPRFTTTRVPTKRGEITSRFGVDLDLRPPSSQLSLLFICSYLPKLRRSSLNARRSRTLLSLRSRIEAAPSRSALAKDRLHLLTPFTLRPTERPARYAR